MSTGFLSIMDLVMEHQGLLWTYVSGLCDIYGKGEALENSYFQLNEVIGALKIGTTNLYQLLINTCSEPLSATMGFSEKIADIIVEKTNELGSLNKVLEKLATSSMTEKDPVKREVASIMLNQWELRSIYMGATGEQFTDYMDQTVANAIRFTDITTPGMHDELIKILSEQEPSLLSKAGK